MKKLITFVLLACLLLPILVGCGPDVMTTLPSWMNGKDAARLLLANERLDVTRLKDAENIFTTGAEVLENLATMSVESLAQYDYAAGLGVTPVADKRVITTDGSVLEIDGQIYKFKCFAEYSNSYDYFKNLTNGVSSTAEQGAELIDNVKKYVRAVDVWVEQGNRRFYLHVEENSETLHSLYIDSEITQHEICRRTKGADGLDVYEIYIVNDIAETVMTYIPGKKCEYLHRSKETDFDHNFLAENTKGYWEVVDVNKAPTHYNVSCMVIKDDICYDAFYTPTHIAEYGRGEELVEGYINMLKVISADRKTDIMFISESLDSETVSVSMALQAFGGYSHLEFQAEDVIREGQSHGDGYYAVTDSGVLVLHNGMRLAMGQTLLGDKVEISFVRVIPQNKEQDLFGYVPTLDIIIRPGEGESWQQLFREFLALTGMSCSRDMATVEAGIAQAYGELNSFVKYHKWNDSLIVSEDTLAKGYENRDARFKAFAAMYDSVKNAEVIDYSNRHDIELRIPFAPITAISVDRVQEDGLYVTVENLSLTVEDTTLFVEGEPYVVHFAMILVGGNDRGLVHIPHENATELVYRGEDRFTVTTSVEFDIPYLAAGEYALVAYISTADGIRTSGYRAVSVHEVSNVGVSYQGVSAIAKRTAEGELHVVFGEESVNRVAVDQAIFTSYDGVMEALAEAAYLYGFVDEDAVLEYENGDGEWIAVTDKESALAYGKYRVKYTVHNGSSIKEGYVTAQYLEPGGQ